MAQAVTGSGTAAVLKIKNNSFLLELEDVGSKILSPATMSATCVHAPYYDGLSFPLEPYIKVNSSWCKFLGHDVLPQQEESNKPYHHLAQRTRT